MFTFHLNGILSMIYPDLFGRKMWRRAVFSMSYVAPIFLPNPGYVHIVLIAVE